MVSDDYSKHSDDKDYDDGGDDGDDDGDGDDDDDDDDDDDCLQTLNMVSDSMFCLNINNYYIQCTHFQATIHYVLLRRSGQQSPFPFCL